MSASEVRLHDSCVCVWQHECIMKGGPADVPHLHVEHEGPLNIMQSSFSHMLKQIFLNVTYKVLTSPQLTY